MDEPVNQLQDSYDRLEAAKADYDEFLVQLDHFLLSYVKRMWKGRNPSRSDNYVVQLPSHKDKNIAGRPRVLFSRVIESLRSALDYAVFVQSERNCPDLNPRHPQFVIVDDKDAFDRVANVQLKHLTPSERLFIERMQPYHGNVVLALMRDASNQSKHRRLLNMRHRANLNLVLADPKDAHKYSGWWRVAGDSDAALFAKPSDIRGVSVVGKYRAVEALDLMISQTEGVLQAIDEYLNTGTGLPDVVKFNYPKPPTNLISNELKPEES